jgi:hypothetical protein
LSQGFQPIKGYWIFIKGFFCINWYNHVILLLVLCYIYWFVYVEPSLHP